MLVLPLIYLGLIVLTGSAVWWINSIMTQMQADGAGVAAPESATPRADLVALLQLDQRPVAPGHAVVVVEAARATYFSPLGRLVEIALTVEETLA